MPSHIMHCNLEPFIAGPNLEDLLINGGLKNIISDCVKSGKCIAASYFCLHILMVSEQHASRCSSYVVTKGIVHEGT